MKLSEIYKSDKTVISFEIFPPDTDEKIDKLYSEITVLKNYNPQFISLTCGAGGKNNENSRKVLQNLKTKFQTDIMPHFTCICSDKNFIDENLEFIKSLKTENILALRGDKPENGEYECRDFCHANELVEYLKLKTNFSIAVAGYPEGHIESPDLKTDIENLKKKIDAGADAIITQMFFENSKFFDFCERVEKAGITVPVVAGVMPVISENQISRMTKLAKITLPEILKETLEKHSDDKNYIKNFGIEFAASQCRELIENKVKGLHFFTLNKSCSSAKILDNIIKTG